LKAPVLKAVVLVPVAIEVLKSPRASAVVPLPSPTAMLVGVLVQPVPALMPLIDAHVASAVAAPPSAHLRRRQIQQNSQRPGAVRAPIS
jgi:hypothetical protein